MEELCKFSNFTGVDVILQYIQVWRVTAAIDSFKPIKAAGLDDLKPIVLQHIGELALAVITNLFDFIFSAKNVASNESSLHPQDGEIWLLSAQGVQAYHSIKLSLQIDGESVLKWKSNCSTTAEPAHKY